VENALMPSLMENTGEDSLIRALTQAMPFWDEVSDIMRYCVANRNAPCPCPLFDLIEQAYMDGGWPCGWKGKYPEGKLAVFSRKPCA
jgi:hypothetical protein